MIYNEEVIEEEIPTPQVEDEQPPKSKLLYDKLYEKNLYSKSYEDFNKQFSDPKSKEKLWNVLKQKGLYTKTKEEFDTQFFAPIEQPKEVVLSTTLPKNTPPQLGVNDGKKRGEFVTGQILSDPQTNESYQIQNGEKVYAKLAANDGNAQEITKQQLTITDGKPSVVVNDLLELSNLKKESNRVIKKVGQVAYGAMGAGGVTEGYDDPLDVEAKNRAKEKYNEYINVYANKIGADVGDVKKILEDWSGLKTDDGVKVRVKLLKENPFKYNRAVAAKDAESFLIKYFAENGRDVSVLSSRLPILRGYDASGAYRPLRTFEQFRSDIKQYSELVSGLNVDEKEKEKFYNDLMTEASIGYTDNATGFVDMAKKDPRSKTLNNTELMGLYMLEDINPEVAKTFESALYNKKEDKSNLGENVITELFGKDEMITDLGVQQQKLKLANIAIQAQKNAANEKMASLLAKYPVSNLTESQYNEYRQKENEIADLYQKSLEYRKKIEEDAKKDKNSNENNLIITSNEMIGLELDRISKLDTYLQFSKREKVNGLIQTYNQNLDKLSNNTSLKETDISKYKETVERLNQLIGEAKPIRENILAQQLSSEDKLKYDLAKAMEDRALNIEKSFYDVNGKYGEVAKYQTKAVAQELFGQRKSFLGNQLNKFGWGMSSQLFSVQDALTRAFDNEAKASANEIGRNIIKKDETYTTLENTYLQHYKVVVQPELQKKVDAINNNKELSDEEKFKQGNRLLDENQDKFYIQPTSLKVNNTLNSFLYGLADTGNVIGQFALKSLGLKGLGSGSKLSEASKVFGIAFADELPMRIAENRENNVPNPISSATLPSIISAAGVAGFAPGAIKGLFGKNTVLGKVISNMSDGDVLKLLNKKNIGNALATTFKDKFIHAAPLTASITAASALNTYLEGGHIDPVDSITEMLVENFKFAILGMVSPMNNAILGTKRSNNKITSSAREFAGINSERFLKAIEKRREDGTISSKEADAMILEVKKAKSIIDSKVYYDRKNNPLTDEVQSALFNNNYRIKEIDSQLKDATISPIEKEKITREKQLLEIENKEYIDGAKYDEKTNSSVGIKEKIEENRKLDLEDIDAKIKKIEAEKPPFFETIIKELEESKKEINDYYNNYLDDTTDTNTLPKKEGEEKTEIPTTKVNEGVARDNELDTTKESSLAEAKPIEVVQPTKEVKVETKPIEVSSKGDDVVKSNTFTRDDLPNATDKNAPNWLKTTNVDDIESKLNKGDKITFFAEKERNGIWDGKMIVDDKGTKWGTLGILSDKDGFIRNDSAIEKEQSKPTEVKAEQPNVSTPQGFTNRVFEKFVQIGEAPKDAHISEEGYNYRTLSQKEIDAIQESGGVLPREGKQKGGNSNTKYWTKGNKENWYGDKDNQETIRVKESNFNKNEVVKSENVEVYNKETKQFEPLIKEQTKTEPNVSETKVEAPKQSKKEFVSSITRSKIIFDKDGKAKVVNAKTGELVSPKTRDKVIAEYAETYDFTEGERVNDVPKVDTDEQAKEYIVENTKSPTQLVEIYLKEEPISAEDNLSQKEFAIVTSGEGITGIRNSSFNRFGDKNNKTLSIGRRYLTGEKGRTLDSVAVDITNKTGVEVTPQDIVDFMMKFPNGVKEGGESNVAKLAKQRFEKLTNIPLTNKIAEKVVEQERLKLEKEVIGDPFTDKNLMEWLNEESQLTPEQETILEDNFNNILYENEQTRNQEKVPVSKPNPKANDAEPAKQQTSAKPKEKASVDVEKVKKIADFIRKGKIDDDILMSGVPFAKEVWNGAVEAMAKTVELTGDIAKAIEDGIAHIKKSDWYKSLSEENKAKAENRFNKEYSQEKINEKIDGEPKDKAEPKADTNFLNDKNIPLTDEKITALSADTSEYTGVKVSNELRESTKASLDLLQQEGAKWVAEAKEIYNNDNTTYVTKMIRAIKNIDGTNNLSVTKKAVAVVSLLESIDKDLMYVKLSKAERETMVASRNYLLGLRANLVKDVSLALNAQRLIYKMYNGKYKTKEVVGRMVGAEKAEFVDEVVANMEKFDVEITQDAIDLVQKEVSKPFESGTTTKAAKTAPITENQVTKNRKKYANILKNTVSESQYEKLKNEIRDISKKIICPQNKK